MSEYYCKKCGKTMERDSDKAWIKSYCEETGDNARLYKVKDNQGEG